MSTAQHSTAQPWLTKNPPIVNIYSSIYSKYPFKLSSKPSLNPLADSVRLSHKTRQKQKTSILNIF